MAELFDELLDVYPNLGDELKRLKHQATYCPILELPEELQTEIYLRLDVDSMARLSSTHTKLRKLFIGEAKDERVLQRYTELLPVRLADLYQSATTHTRRFIKKHKFIRTALPLTKVPLASMLGEVQVELLEATLDHLMCRARADHKVAIRALRKLISFWSVWPFRPPRERVSEGDVDYNVQHFVPDHINIKFKEDLDDDPSPNVRALIAVSHRLHSMTHQV